MAEASASVHEDKDAIRPETIERHRAIVSLIEELEAVDWYDQRIDATQEPELRAILAHNRDEEKEHAAMVLEWLRRSDPVFDKELRDYLFTEGSLGERAAAAHGGPEGAEAGAGDGSLGIGSLKEIGDE